MHRNLEKLRLLITDALHPVTSETMTGLRRAGVVSWVAGTHSNRSEASPPPGLDAIERVSAPSSIAFSKEILALAIKHQIDVVMPWADTDVLAISANSDAFAAAGIAILSPPAQLVALACDKWKAICAFRNAGVMVPESRLISAPRELVSEAANLGYPDKAVIVKVRNSAGSRGVWVIDAQSDLSEKRTIPSLRIEAMAAQLEGMCSNGWSDGLVLQSLAHGTDVSIDVLARSGIILGATCRTRRTVIGGLCVSGEIFPLDSKLAQSVGHLVKRLSWDGIANIQAILTELGDPLFYEINPRAAGSVGVSALAGFDLLAGAIRLTIGLEPWPGVSGLGSVHETVAFRRQWSTHT